MTFSDGSISPAVRAFSFAPSSSRLLSDSTALPWDFGDIR